MSISTDEVAKVAGLARLNLGPEKVEQFAGQFNDILGYMEKLNELDTSGVEPLYSPVTHETVFRDDEVRQDYTREEILGNAPDTDGSYFIVPRIVG
ncbi:Asp-tRNA(Asn)/Glu-tRNA(Gln) amidotransferase subunit GatC [Desulfonatronum parangueonense]